MKRTVFEPYDTEQSSFIYSKYISKKHQIEKRGKRTSTAVSKVWQYLSMSRVQEAPIPAASEYWTTILCMKDPRKLSQPKQSEIGRGNEEKEHLDLRNSKAMDSDQSSPNLLCVKRNLEEAPQREIKDGFLNKEREKERQRESDLLVKVC